MKVSHINLDLVITPEEQKLSAKCTLNVHNIKEKITFYLNKQLKMKSVKISIGEKTLDLEPIKQELPEDAFLKACNLWELKCPQVDNDEIRLYYEYGGKIESDSWGTNYLLETAIELGIYVGYYPIIAIEDQPSFTLTLNGPSSWKWLMNAPKVEAENILTWSTKEPRIDLYLLGLPSHLAISEDGIFWGRKKNFPIYEDLSDGLEDMETTLRGWLGETPTKNFHLALVPRESGGLISRNGVIAMQDNLDEEIIKKNTKALLFSWTHEIGHFWFSKTSVSNYHNWMDEALCDFCALLVTQDKFGDEFYKERLSTFKQIVRESKDPLSPITETTRNHPQADLLYYKYGLLILHDLMQVIGKELMKKTIANFAQKCVKSDKIETQDFVESLKEITNKDYSTLLMERLSNPPNAELLKEEEQ